MSKIIAIIAELPNRLRSKQQLEDTITRIGGAEQRRIQLEAKYLPFKPYKIATDQLATAREWLWENGLRLESVKAGPMWAIVNLNTIELGVLAERQIHGVPYDEANQPRYIHNTSEPGYTDYERIG